MDTIDDAIFKIHEITKKIQSKLQDPKARTQAIASFMEAQSRANVLIRPRGESVCNRDITCLRSLHNGDVPVRPAAGVSSAPLLHCDAGASGTCPLPELK
jgi:hypothetical protein